MLPVLSDLKLTLIFAINTIVKYNIMFTKNSIIKSVLMLLLLTTVVCCKKEPVVDKPDPEPDDGSISGTLSRDTVFTNINADPNACDYYITGVLNVESVLQIDSGVVIEMGEGASIVIKTTGTLIAKGSASNPIKITGRTKSRGSWKYIMVNSNDPRNEMSYVNIEYGGGDNSNNGTLYMNTGGFLKMQFSKISNSKNNAIVLAADDAHLEGFTDNQIEYCEYPMQIKPNQIPEINDNTVYANNDHNYITLTGAYIRTPLTWSKKSIPYVHKGTTVIEADVSMTQGVNIQMDFGSMIQVRPEGSLNATGTASEKIVFSSVQQVQGYWHCLLFGSRSTNNRLAYVDISYGGGSPEYISSVYVGAPMGLPEAIVSISNCNISMSAGWGIYVQSNASMINGGGNTYANNIMGNVGP